MDRWTVVGVVVTALGATLAFWLIKGLLGFLIDNWPWILLAVMALFGVGLFAVNKEGSVPKRDL